MTDLPYIFEMDPDEWFDQVQEIADELAGHIASALDEHDDAEAVLEALQPHLEPYIIDPDDPSQHQLLADVDGERFCIGRVDDDWLALTYRDEGYWWLSGREPDEEDPDPATLHRQLGRKAVDTVSWGNSITARERADNQKAKRTILEPFLHAIEDAGGLDASAADIRDDLESLIASCLPFEEKMTIDDHSPDDEHTHFVIMKGDEEIGHVLAVSPGASRETETLEEAFDMELSADAGVRIVTDHLRFVWYPYLGTKTASNDLILPSDKDDDVVDYFYEIDWTVSQLIRSLNPAH